MTRTAHRVATAAAVLALATLGPALTAAPAHAGSPAPNADPAPSDSTLINPTSDSALINLLDRQGVRYEPATTVDAATAGDLTHSTLVLDEDSGLSAADLKALSRLPFARVVVLGSDPEALSALTGGALTAAGQAGPPAAAVPADCAYADAFTAGPADFPEPVALYHAGNAGGIACYGIGDGSAVAYLPPGPRPYDVVALGSDAFAENRALASDGDAALALHIFGAHSHLVWLASSFILDPAIDDCAGCDFGNQAPQAHPSTVTASPQAGNGANGGSAAPPTLESMLPPWIWAVLLQLLVAVLLTAYWRGRRLGPVVTETLPVTVRAAETIEGHARLYRRAGAHARAAELLRSATASRLAASFGLPAARAHADPSILVTAVAARLNTPPQRIADLLAGPPPQSEADLVHLADRLDRLEQEVRSP